MNASEIRPVKPVSAASLSMNRVVVGQASRLPMGRLAPGFIAGETPAQTAGTAAPLPTQVVLLAGVNERFIDH